MNVCHHWYGLNSTGLAHLELLTKRPYVIDFKKLFIGPCGHSSGSSRSTHNSTSF